MILLFTLLVCNTNIFSFVNGYVSSLANCFAIVGILDAFFYPRNVILHPGVKSWLTPATLSVTTTGYSREYHVVGSVDGHQTSTAVSLQVREVAWLFLERSQTWCVSTYVTTIFVWYSSSTYVLVFNFDEIFHDVLAPFIANDRQRYFMEDSFKPNSILIRSVDIERSPTH